MYDWRDANADHTVDYGELALVNRAGSWGTGQELRVSYPHMAFEGVPVVGVYPVPVQASYWTGITDRNSTAINYTMTVSYYTYGPWDGDVDRLECGRGAARLQLYGGGGSLGAAGDGRRRAPRDSCGSSQMIIR